MNKLSVFIMLMILLTSFSACNQQISQNSQTPADISEGHVNPPTDNGETQDTEVQAPAPTKFEKAISPKPDQAIEKHIEELTNNGSRKWGTASELEAACYLKEQMGAYGYTAYLQEFPAYEYDMRASGTGDYFDINPYDSEVIGSGHNVIANLNADDTSRKILVLSAHYDTVSSELGIIDNTSGVVALLEVARQVSDLELPFDLRFIFFSMEERYLLGSIYYVGNLSEDELIKIVACINVDMVGYKDGQEIVVATPYYVNREPGSRSLDGIPNALTDEWHRIFPEHNTYVKGDASSDHVSFEKKGIPNMLITQKHFDYETVRKRDSDFENLSIEELENTINMIVKYIKNLDTTKIN